MSTVIAEVVLVDDIIPHPNADRLDIAVVGGAKIVVGKGSFSKGGKAVYFPPDLLIPNPTAEKLGVAKYLKHSVFPGDVAKSQCRVAATRLRGTPSYGFLVPIEDVFFGGDEEVAVGTDVSAFFNAVKYEPPTNPWCGARIPMAGEAPAHPAFPKYTDIDRYLRYADAIPEGTEVVFTEKIHGTNSRVGLINVDGEWQFMAGSHNVNRKKPEDDKPCAYWGVLDLIPVLELLSFLCNEQHSVVMYGEIYGPGIQDMDYGVPAEMHGYRVFGITVDGRYLNWDEMVSVCAQHDVQTVPLLYRGPYSREVVEQYTDGPTTIGEPAAKFKGREGIVITPTVETYSDKLSGRMILKSISADYLDRKGAVDYA